MGDLETLLYEAADGVAWVTLNRPDVHNAFDPTMQAELRQLWRALRADDDVRCIVLTGAGEKAFSVGLDRASAASLSQDAAEDGDIEDPNPFGPYWFDDPGDNLGPKSNQLWKPVIAAVNGMACGGAFYLLGEADFIIAVDDATFFDPHVTYGMVAGFEPIQMLQKMPFGEIMRLSLLGNHERLSAGRAHEIGLVSEVVERAELRASAQWAADAIASAPAAAIQGTVRSLWMARDLGRRQALDLAWPVVDVGTNEDTLAEGQAFFASGRRIDPRIR